MAARTPDEFRLVFMNLVEASQFLDTELSDKAELTYRRYLIVLCRELAEAYPNLTVKQPKEAGDYAQAKSGDTRNRRTK